MSMLFICLKLICSQLGFSAIWNFNSTSDEIESVYNLTHEFTEKFREIAPNSGSYFVSNVLAYGLLTAYSYLNCIVKNEGDVHETDHEGECLFSSSEKFGDEVFIFFLFLSQL